MVTIATIYNDIRVLCACSVSLENLTTTDAQTWLGIEQYIEFINKIKK